MSKQEPVIDEAASLAMRNKISTIKASLILQQPFFGVFLTNTDVIESKDIPTAATNGVSIWYNVGFFQTLTDQELKAVLMHETLHMVYLHCSLKRRGTRNTKKWNYAVDYAINWEIDELGMKLPKSALLDHKWKSFTAEAIYDKLPDDPQGNEGFDIHLDMPSDEATMDDMQDKIIATYEATKLAGKTPASIERYVSELRKAKIPWSRLFMRYIGSALNHENHSWAKPNRRFLSMDLFLPSLGTRDKVARVLYAIDTSGSIGEKELKCFSSEAAKLSALIQETVVASWDTEVHSWEVVHEMGSGLQKALKKVAGGGGTSVESVWNEVKKRKETFDVVVVVTDGYFGTLPPKNPLGGTPIIFVVTTDVDIQNKFGAVVRMDVNKT